MRTARTLLPIAATLLSCAFFNAPTAGATIYLSDHDINCPYWEVKTPWTGYGAIATGASAACVVSYSGRIWGGGAFAENRPPLYAALNLWRRSGGRYTIANQAAYRLSDCSTRKVDFAWWILRVTQVKLCGATNMLARTGVYPPRGCYHGELIVKSLAGETLLDDANSRERCF